MPFERKGQEPTATKESPAAGFGDGAVRAVEKIVDRSLDRIEHVARDLVGTSLELTSAHVTRALLDLRAHTDEAAAKATGQVKVSLQELVGDIDARFAKHVESLEGQSLKRLEQALNRSLESTAENARKQGEQLIDSLGRKVFGLAMPVLSFYVATRLRATSGADASGAGVVLWSWTAVSAAGAVLLLADATKTWLASARKIPMREALAVTALDMMPFLVLGLILAVVFGTGPA